jgi:hypothetical protein
MAQNYKLSDVLQSIQNSQIRIALEQIMAIAGIGLNDRVDDAIVKNITGIVTGSLVGNSAGVHTGAVTGDVVGDIKGVITGSNSSGLINMLIQNAQVGSGGLGLYQRTNAADITADTSVDIDVDVPAGAVLLGAQLIVTGVLAGGETWDAAYKTGSTQAITSGAAVAKNTKVSTLFDANGATAITSDVTKITIAPNGGGSFTAQGAIRAVVYYMAFTALDDQA